MLTRLQNLKETIKVSIVGVGALGKGSLYQTTITPGIECVAIADPDVHKCVETVRWLGIPHRTVSTQNELDDAINDGYLAICEDGNMVAKAASVEAVLEGSNNIHDAAEHALTAIKNQRHLIMLNPEVDLIFGPHLMKMAQDSGVTYSSVDGSRHASLRKLYDEMMLWGFDPVMAGSIKSELNRDANPTTILPFASGFDLDNRACASISDGTHLNIEMALVANGLDMVTAVPGMYGFETESLQDVPNLYDLEILHSLNKPVVDYIVSSQPHNGVFAIGYNDSPYQMEMMQQFRMGKGPFYIFHRAYHLAHIEAMSQIATAVLDETALLAPTYGFRTNVYAYAKTDLKAGHTLDGVGGYSGYGLIENCPPINEDWGLPICLSEGVVLRRDIQKGDKINLMDVEFDPTSLSFDLYFKSQKRDLVHMNEASFRPGQYTHW